MNRYDLVYPSVPQHYISSRRAGHWKAVFPNGKLWHIGPSYNIGEKVRFVQDYSAIIKEYEIVEICVGAKTIWLEEVKK